MVNATTANFSYTPDKSGRHLSTSVQDFKFDYWVAQKEDSTLPTIIFFNGAVDRTKAPDGVVFQRSSWADELNANVICVNDGCLIRDPRARLTWAQGDGDLDYLELVSRHLRQIISEDLKCTEDIILFGSSGGGFQALQIAAKMRTSMVVVNNPQTDWHRYELAHTVRKANELAYGTSDLVEAKSRFPERISVIESYSRSEYLPNIKYLLNAASKNDYVDQYSPFASAFAEGYFSLGEFDVHMYYNTVSGHSPMAKNQTIRKLNGIASELKSKD